MRCSVILSCFVCTTVPLAAQSPWTFRTSAFISGNGDRSDPAGYEVYSGIGLVAGVSRYLGGPISAELSFRTESREVDSVSATGSARRLGSLELLPVNLMLQAGVSPSAAIRPYGGLGVNATVAWEKTGVLDSMDVSPRLGIALQAGADFRLGSPTVLNVDAKWNTYRPDISSRAVRQMTLKVDPLLLSAGVGFRF